MVIHIGIPGDLMEITRILGFYCKMPKVNNFPRQGDLMAMGKEIGIPLDTRFRAERLPRYHYGYGWKTRRPCEPDDNTCSYERLINRCSPFHSHDCFWPDLLIGFDPYPHTHSKTLGTSDFTHKNLGIVPTTHKASFVLKQMIAIAQTHFALAVRAFIFLAAGIQDSEPEALWGPESARRGPWGEWDEDFTWYPDHGALFFLV